MNKLQAEFRKLKRRYKIKNTKLLLPQGGRFPAVLRRICTPIELHGTFSGIYVSRPWRAKNKGRLKADPRDKSHYIYVDQAKLCGRSLMILLHEIGHALQFQSKRLPQYQKSYRKAYAMELEAECFAVSQYNKYYADKYGKSHWDFPNYGSWKKLVKGQSNTVHPANLDQLFRFIKQLPKSDSKHIIKQLQNI